MESRVCFMAKKISTGETVSFNVVQEAPLRGTKRGDYTLTSVRRTDHDDIAGIGPGEFELCSSEEACETCGYMFYEALWTGERPNAVKYTYFCLPAEKHYFASVYYEDLTEYENEDWSLFDPILISCWAPSDDELENALAELAEVSPEIATNRLLTVAVMRDAELVRLYIPYRNRFSVAKYRNVRRLRDLFKL